jgi:nucleoside-diphosphate-sugar epimerase
VRALVRKESDTRWLETQGVELAYGDLTDRAALGKACAGASCVYHAAARVGDWGPWEEFQQISIEGTSHLIDAAAEAGARRFIHISSISAYGHPNGAGLVFDETAPLGSALHQWSDGGSAELAVWAAGSGDARADGERDPHGAGEADRAGRQPAERGVCG